MTRHGLLQLMGAAPLASLAGRSAAVAEDTRIRVYLGPGTYRIAAGGGIWLSQQGVRIEGCAFEVCRVEIVASDDVADATALPS